MVHKTKRKIEPSVTVSTCYPIKFLISQITPPSWRSLLHKNVIKPQWCSSHFPHVSKQQTSSQSFVMNTLEHLSQTVLGYSCCMLRNFNVDVPQNYIWLDSWQVLEIRPKTIKLGQENWKFKADLDTSRKRQDFSFFFFPFFLLFILFIYLFCHSCSTTFNVEQALKHKRYSYLPVPAGIKNM